MFDLDALEMNSYTYKEWLSYFKSNAKQPFIITCSKKDNLTQTEYDRIFPSIRIFQKGEGSQGNHLRKVAHNFAKEIQDEHCMDVIDLFIKEENCHSAYLNTYMNYHGVPKKNHSILDFFFRKIRKYGTFQNEIIVLVTAEIIALNYYRALEQNTNSPALQTICQKMLHDECAHIVFQSYQLSHFKNTKERQRKILMTISATLEYWAHLPIYKQAHVSYFSFMETNRNILNWSIHFIRERKNKYER